MKKKFFFLLITVMCVSLVGTVIVQGYWIKKTVDANESRFSFNARQSLINVAQQAQRQELDKYYLEYAAQADSVGVPTSADLSQIFHIEKNDRTNEMYFYTYSVLQKDYKVQSEIPGMEQDSIHFKTLVNTKITQLVKKSDLDDRAKLRSHQKFVSVTQLRDKDRALLEQVIRDKTAQLPIFDRIKKNKLKKLIDKQLKRRGITSSYEFGIFSNGLATKVSTSGFDLNSPSSYGITIFPSPMTDYKLFIHFTGKKLEIFSSVFWLATLSFIFTFFIVLVFIGAVYQLFKTRKISQIKSDFINNMTHEFKTPIATINLALDSIRNPKVFGDADRVNNYLKMIKAENHRMHAQVENVLRISRLERNELNIHKERLDLHELIKSAISHINLIVENREGYVHTHLDATKSTFLANESHFTNVLVNILDNAVKYSDDRPKIDIYTENARNFIVVRISDQGNGMVKAVQKKIFEKFYREHAGNIHNVKGHGLGLAYVKKIVEDHQGQIGVESDKGKGSTFIIKLPLIS